MIRKVVVGGLGCGLMLDILIYIQTDDSRCAGRENTLTHRYSVLIQELS